jgi:hypothetical protein
LNWINGNAGNDQLHAGYGASSVYGGDGNDNLWGGQGSDYLSGDAGDDVIVSIGGGSDVLHGGDGNDNFWCDNATIDRIDDVSTFESLNGYVHRVNRFANGVSNQLIGQNLPDPKDSGTTHNFASDPLFSTAGPVEDDIYQGQAGDCYFLAALSATAKTDPTEIRKSVVDLGDGTYGVQFWWQGQPQIIRVDADLPTDSYGDLVNAKLGQGNSLWVPIMEKAFAYERTLANTYASTSGGGSTEVFQDLNARGIAEVRSFTSGNNLLAYIQSELNAGKAVTVGTPTTVTSDCPCITLHVYTVDHVNYRTLQLPGLGIIRIPISVTLRNPWGNNYGVNSNVTDPASAYVTVTAAQAFGSFSAVYSALA